MSNNHIYGSKYFHAFYLDFDSRHFWGWTDFQSYLDFMLVFWAVGAAVTYLMLPYVFFMEAVGFAAVFIEAMLGAPQFMRNFKTKSTEGMSIQMVMMWLAGDLFKTCYFVVRAAPAQFWLCGTLQVSIYGCSTVHASITCNLHASFSSSVSTRDYLHFVIFSRRSYIAHKGNLDTCLIWCMCHL